MNATLRRLLVYKNLGSILFDERFRIKKIDEAAGKITDTLGHARAPKIIFDLFPELIGSEQFLSEILHQNKDDYQLDYVNRIDRSGNPIVLNLYVFADEKHGHGLLILEEVTAQAQAQQEKNQQRFELFLYRHDQKFRQRFLSDSILGHSAAIQEVRKTIHKLSNVPSATVLLLGETGSGKNLAARVIHYSSMPVDAPLIDINCAALPEHLIESELFGYEKGAFTHATASRKGLFEEAGEGTIFLDEIAELPLNLQAKLLTVLETKKFRRLGSNRLYEVKARIISATNRDLAEEVKKKNFRDDLFYRLNVVSLKLPPLRELGEDILVIAEHLLKIFNIEFKKQVNGFSKEAQQVLLQYHWPGNVRELSNCLERTMIFIEKDRIDAADLSIIKAAPSPADPADRYGTLPAEGIVLEDVERQLIVSALKQAHNNKSKAARLLGLTRDTLRYRLEKYQLG